jgi:type IX secretion system PorP/SprF family membrane protein
MKTMINRIKMLKNFLAVSLIGLALPTLGQQMNFSQYQLTPLLNNPSLMATSEEIKADFGYRSQFGGKQGNFSTPYLAGYMPLYTKDNNDQAKKFGAAGVQFLTDRTGYNGMLATTGFSIAYAHITNLSHLDKLSFGLQPGIFQRRVDFGKITTGSQWDGYNGAYDPNRSLNESLTSTERKTFVTINAGITYIRENKKGEPILTLSVGGNNMTRPNISLNSNSFKNPVFWNFQASVLAFEDKQFMIKPTFRHIQVRNLNQTNLGSYFYYKLTESGFIKNGNIGLGVWYSNQNAIVTALEINQRDWALGFSYDFLTSSLANANNSTGAPEVIIGFRKFIGRKKNVSDINASGGGGGGGDFSGKLDGPKKANPTKTEITPEPEAKPAPAKPVAKDTVAAPTAPAPVVPQVIAPEKVEAPAKAQDIVKEKPATPAKEKPAVKAKAKPKAKPAAAKRAGTKARPKGSIQSKKRPKSNLTPEMEKKLADVVTPDEYLGDDPYKGTQMALSQDQKALLKKQPRFGFNGYEIDENTADQLAQLASIMKSRPKMKLEIGGFGCDLGGPEVTKLVALGRAETVRRFLVSKGVPEDQVVAKSYGVANPIRSNAGEEGKIANRRVQFKFISE